MLINLYIEVPDQLAKDNLESWLTATGYYFYDATQWDSLCSGPCKVNSLFDVEIQLEGK